MASSIDKEALRLEVLRALKNDVRLFLVDFFIKRGEYSFHDSVLSFV